MKVNDFTMSNWPVWQTRFHNAARGMAVLAAFSLPMPTAWISISMSLLLLFWIIGGDYKIKLVRIVENPVAIWSLPLLAMLAIGVSYSAVDNADAWHKVSSYLKLLYIPLLISVLDKPVWYRRAAFAFLAAMFVVLATSYLLPPVFWCAAFRPTYARIHHVQKPNCAEFFHGLCRLPLY
jgi:hypothetical protein